MAPASALDATGDGRSRPITVAVACAPDQPRLRPAGYRPEGPRGVFRRRSWSIPIDVGPFHHDSRVKSSDARESHSAAGLFTIARARFIVVDVIRTPVFVSENILLLHIRRRPRSGSPVVEFLGVQSPRLRYAAMVVVANPRAVILSSSGRSAAGSTRFASFLADLAALSYSEPRFFFRVYSVRAIRFMLGYRKDRSAWMRDCG